MTYEGETGIAQARQEASGVASTARDEAGSVATAAKEQAQQVSGTAREQVHAVAGEAKEKARDVVGDVREEVRRRADEQGARAASALHETGRHLRSMADNSDGDDMITGFVHQAAEQVERFATRLDDGGMERMMADVRDYARRKPGTFLVAAGVAGFVVGRLARNASGVMSGGENTAPDDGATPQRYATPTPYAPSPASPASPSLTGVGIDPAADPTYNGGLGTPMPTGEDMPYLGGATPPDVYSEGTR